MRKGRRIQSRRLGTTKYKGLEMANEEETIKEVDRALYRPL